MPDSITGMTVLAFALSCLCAYLIGCVNFGIIISKRMYKQDVRELGSGNSGMTNVLRNFGKYGAILTLVGDMGKGVLSVFVARWLFILLAPGVDTLYGAWAAAVITIIGHMFPVFFGFKGGKGVATAGGVILALQPVLALSLIGVFLLVFLLSKMVSLGAVVGIGFFAPAAFVYAWFYKPYALWYCTVCAAIISLLVIYMHRGNIRRIRAGTEYKFGDKKKK